MLGYNRAVWGAKPHRCNCKDTEAVFSSGSSTRAEGMHKTLSSLALHQCWVTTELYGVQSLIGVSAGTEKAVFSLVCRAEGMHKTLSSLALQQCWVTTGLYGVPNLTSVTAMTEKAVFSLVADQHCSTERRSDCTKRASALMQAL